jgi:hypothetical protein
VRLATATYDIIKVKCRYNLKNLESQKQDFLVRSGSRSFTFAKNGLHLLKVANLDLPLKGQCHEFDFFINQFPPSP